jgi:hypothetical protein
MLNPSRLLGALPGTVCLVLFAACGSSGGGGSCDKLAACCNGMSDAAKSVCTMAHDTAVKQSGQAERACGDLLDAYKGQNQCTSSTSGDGDKSNGGDGDGTHAGDGDSTGAGGQPAVCADYLSCAAEVTPGTLPGLLDSYGPSGTCWSSGAQLASTCETACTSGVEQYHKLGHCTSPTGGDGDIAVGDGDGDIEIPGGDGDTSTPDDSELISKYCAKAIECDPMVGFDQQQCEAAFPGVLLNQSADCAAQLRKSMQCVVAVSGCSASDCPQPSAECSGGMQ